MSALPKKDKTDHSLANHKLSERDSARRSRQLQKKKNHNKRKYAREELLIEAANVNGADNQQWIMSRKRVEQMSDSMESKEECGGRLGGDFKTAEKVNSRRGCYNTLTFPEMDLVPEILQRNNNKDTDKTSRREQHCVITGLRAHYWDPLTKAPYFDANAFKELRRRRAMGMVCRLQSDFLPGIQVHAVAV